MIIEDIIQIKTNNIHIEIFESINLDKFTLMSEIEKFREYFERNKKDATTNDTMRTALENCEVLRKGIEIKFCGHYSIAPVERSFSNLAFIMTPLNTTMVENRITEKLFVYFNN